MFSDFLISFSLDFRHGIEVPHHHGHQALLTHSYCHGIGSEPLIGETIGQRMDKITEMYPDRECVVFVDDNKRVTFADFREEVTNFQESKMVIFICFY